MTNNEEAITILKREFLECKDTISVYARKRKKAFEMAIKALEQMERYKPIFLQEHDAEPRRLIAILDVKKDGIYILETTKGFAESMGMTIEDRNAEE